MLAALLLDLGETLVHGTRVIENVPEALKAVFALRTELGAPLALGLVSDYTMPATNDPAEVARLFDEYVALVRSFGVLTLFEPVDEHITLSTQAGARKPDPAIFRLAMTRLGLEPDLTTAMFITEAPDHVAAARALGMTAWQFGADFIDWSQAPLLVARAIGERQPDRLLEAVALRARALYARQAIRVRAVDDDAIVADVDDDPPCTVHFARGPDGDIVGAVDVPASEVAKRFASVLHETGTLAGEGEELAPGQTHRLEPGPDGTPRPKRKRFSIT